MRNLLNILCLLALLDSYSVSAQINEDFTDGDFTTGTVWSGDAADWTVISGELRTNGPAVTPTQVYLSTPSTTATNSQWEFYVNPKCATSSGNYMIVALVSDQANIEGNFNGYYVMVGNTTDEISLYRKDGGIATIIINGTDATIASSSNNPFKVKVIRDAASNWSLEIDNTGTGTNFVSQGTINDNTYTSSSFFGIMVNYSAANNLKYFADNIYIGPIIVDNTPPVIVSATAISATELDVDFDETVELISAETSTNYSVNGGIGNPTTAVRDGADPSIVHLTFAGSFVSMQNYTLTVNNVEDASGNAISNGPASFNYVPISTAGFRDVIINEIFADPSPVVGLPAGEFIEVYNRSNANIDLSGWTLSDGSATVTFPAQLLLPGDHVILCASSNVATYTPFGTTLGAGSFISLNNTGDLLTLKNQFGNVVDVVEYADGWYQNSTKAQGGWTLELINPTLDCSGSSNWIASNNSLGGTPGTQNSVFSNAPDNTPPFISGFTIVNQNQIQIQFSENMDSTSLVNGSWTINGGLTITLVQPVGPDFIFANVLLNPVMDSSTVYELILSQASDCSGNTMPADTLEFGIGTDALPFEIVINELFPDPDGSTLLPESEFIELRNTTNKVINLNNYTIGDATSFSTINNCILFPYDIVILTANANFSDYSSLGYTVGLSSLPSLNNSGDNITLKNTAGTIIHKVNYTDDWYNDAVKAQGGWSLEMIDPLNPCGEETNWRASNDASGGTPGRENSVYAPNPDLTAPYPVLAEAINATTVIVTFNETMDSLSMLLGNYIITNGIGVISQSVSGSNSIMLTVSPALQNQTIYSLTATQCEDCVGNNSLNTSISFALPDTPQAGDLIINEVLFDPRGAGSDFVEIYNNSQRFISLKNWYLANGNNDTVSDAKIISEQVNILFPGEYLALTIDGANIVQEYPFAQANRVLTIPALPSYNNDEGKVYLIDDQNRISDQFSYTSDMHFSLLQSIDGVSLERIDFNRPSSDLSNWHSAAEAVNFATPGYENSQLQPAESSNELTVDPATFSPDNDGYQDVVNISYLFDQAGYVGNITIYDAQGRIVRLLMQNELLAAKGTISWDGINEKREKARTGMYVVYMEVFDLTGATKHYKKALVLAAKF